MAGQPKPKSTESDADSARYALIRQGGTARRMAILGVGQEKQPDGSTKARPLTDKERYALILGFPLEQDEDNADQA